MSYIDEYNEKEKRRKEKLVVEDLKRKLNPECVSINKNTSFDIKPSDSRGQIIRNLYVALSKVDPEALRNITVKLEVK